MQYLTTDTSADSRRAASNVGLMVLFVMLSGGCQAELPDCYDGFIKQEDGRCVADGERGQAVDLELDDTGVEPQGDTASPDVILGPCEAPVDLPTDPIAEIGELSLIEDTVGPPSIMMELVQVRLQPEREMLWGVGHGGLFGFDISDPATPALVFQAPESGHGRYYNLWLPGSDDLEQEVIYTTHRDQGLWVIDTASLDAPEELASWGYRGLAGMDAVGDFLYIAQHGGEVLTLDISDRRAPVEQSVVEGMSAGWTVKGRPGVLYGADNVDGVVVFDLSDPSAPLAVGSVDVGGGVQALALSGNTLYAAASSAGVVALDISDPLHPVWLDTWVAGESVQDIAVDGSTLWAVTQQSVVAIDIADPGRLSPISSRETPFWSMAIDAVDGEAWVGDWGAVRGYERVLDTLAADLSMGASELLLPDSGQTLVPLRNRGSAELHVVGLEASEDALDVSISQTRLAPGETAMLDVRATAEVSGATVCIATNDPDAPIQELTVHAGSGSGTGSIGSMAPDFVLVDLDGEYHSLSEMIGHPVVLVYFATW